MGGEQSSSLGGTAGSISGNDTLPMAASGDDATSEINRDISRMDARVSRKLRTGIQVNIKVIIRGDRNTGKSALWHRLQGFELPNQVMHH
jgi:hypothetical protein